MTNNSMTVYEPPTMAIQNDFDTMQRMSVALYESGFFSDIKSKAQAITKVMAGAELGLPPFASMTGIHIIQGKAVLGANVIATLIDNHPRYDFKPVKHDATICTIEFYRNGQPVGVATFTMEEAQKAGLANKDNWKKYPSDMLFARAISRGARRFAPGIFGGAPVYTPDEMGVDTDEDGYITPADNGPEWPPEPPPEPTITTAQKRKLHAAGIAYYGDKWDDKRHELVSAVTKKRTESSNDLTQAEAQKLIDGIDELASKEPEPLFPEPGTGGAYSD